MWTSAVVITEAIFHKLPNSIPFIYEQCNIAVGEEGTAWQKLEIVV